MPRDIETTGLTRAVADHVAGLRSEDLPADAVAAAKRLMLDTLGVARAGSDAAGVAESRALMLAQGGAGESLVWTHGDRLPAMAAAFVNGVAAAALDYDSLHEAGVVHADIVVLPAALALAEREHATGRELLAALVVGNDLACRLGMSMRENRGWFLSSLHGVFGAAAAAARILHLDAAATCNALGIALSRTGGTQQPAMERSLTKRMQTAFAAREGLFAALLAEQGITGPQEAFEGRCGLYGLYEEGDQTVVLAELGRRFENVNTSIKKYPSCACNYAAIVATLDLVTRHDIVPSDVAETVVVISPYMDRLVGRPFDPGITPQIAGQFSVQYSIASILLRRRLGVPEIRDDAVCDPAVAALIPHIKVVVDEANSGTFAPVRLAIRMKDGRQFQRQVDEIPGTPENPMTEAELLEKFHACTALGVAPMTEAASVELARRIAALEESDDVSTLFDGIT